MAAIHGANGVEFRRDSQAHGRLRVGRNRADTTFGVGPLANEILAYAAGLEVKG